MKDKYILLGDSDSPHLFKWYEELKTKYDVHVITFNPSKRYVYHSITSFPVSVNSSGGNFGYIKYVFKIAKLLKEIRPKYVNAHYITSYGLISVLASIFSQVRGEFKLVLSAWGSDVLVTAKKNMVYSLLFRFCFYYSDLITSDSHLVTNEVEKTSCTKVVTFPMGITKEDICVNSVKREKKTFLSLRALVDNSNVNTIVGAFAIAAKEYDDIELIIANDGPLRGELELLVQELGLSEKVKFYGLLEKRELFELMRSCHTYVTVPTSDALSVSLMEALASEMFVIASKLPSNYELLGKRNAFFAELEEKDLADKLDRTLALNKSDLEEVYDYNRKLLQENCLWSNNIKALYNELD